MTWYFWNPETDELRPQIYSILKDSEDLWVPEMEAIHSERIKNMRVGESLIGDLWISTVFLGLDHGWNGIPLLFETMMLNVRTLKWLGFQDRYATGKEARAAHAKIDWLGRWLLLKTPQVSKRTFEKVMREI